MPITATNPNRDRVMAQLAAARQQALNRRTAAPAAAAPAGQTTEQRVFGGPTGGTHSSFSAQGTYGDIGPSVRVYDSAFADNVGTEFLDMVTSQEDRDNLVKANEMYDSMMGNVTGLANELSSGAIPDDVAAQVRMLASERASQSGIGLGQSGRALTARDLGLTSLQLKQTGAALSAEAAKLSEARGQFIKSYILDSRKLLEDIRRTDLQATELMEMSRQFNVGTEFKVDELMAQTMIAMHQIQAQYMSMDDEGSMQGGIDSLANDIGDFLDSLRGGNSGIYQYQTSGAGALWQT